MVISLRHPLFHIERHVLQDTIHIHFQIKVSKISSLTTQHQPRFMAWLRDYIHIKPWDMSKFQRQFIFSLRESIPRLLNEGTTTMTARCARLAARPSQSNPRGSGPEVLKRERGHVTSETGVAEVAVFGALQPNVNIYWRQSMNGWWSSTDNNGLWVRIHTLLTTMLVKWCPWRSGGYRINIKTLWLRPLLPRNVRGYQNQNFMYDMDK